MESIKKNWIVENTKMALTSFLQLRAGLNDAIVRAALTDGNWSGDTKNIPAVNAFDKKMIDSVQAMLGGRRTVVTTDQLKTFALAIFDACETIEKAEAKAEAKAEPKAEATTVIDTVEPVVVH